MQIIQTTTSEQIEAARSLFQEYAAWLGIDLCFQRFDDELVALPGLYAPPQGCLLLATNRDRRPVGCVGVRPFGSTLCEMKRLYVKPDYQRRGMGRALAQRAIAEAREIGYSTMVLDTLPVMRGAIALYESLGFVPRPAYYNTPLRETIFMELNLGA